MVSMYLVVRKQVKLPVRMANCIKLTENKITVSVASLTKCWYSLEPRGCVSQCISPHHSSWACDVSGSVPNACGVSETLFDLSHVGNNIVNA